MATGTYAPDPVFTGWDDNGDPLAAGLLYTYAAGTTTLLATYPNVNLTPGTENANPIVLDAAGRATIFLLPTSYKWILKTSAGATVWTRDNIGAVPTTNIDNDVTGTAGEALTATKAAYLDSSTWKLADADAIATSTTPPIGFVVSDTANGASGTFRLSGRMTGFSGLTPGSDYYVSGTAGAITATAPTNARYVGRADSISSLIIAPNPMPEFITTQVDRRVKTLANGRLTLTSGTPVTKSDVTAATTLYYALYEGNQIALYTGSAWQVFTIAQLSIAVPATTSQMYDVFVDYNSGTPALSLTAWTNDTTRATALTTQDGVYVLTGATGKRYVGSFRTTGVSGQTEDSEAKRFVWNYYWRLPRALKRYDTTASWTYTTATVRQANNSTSNQVNVVVGVAEAELDLSLFALGANAPGGALITAGIGEDSTTTYVAGALYTSASGAYAMLPSRIVKYPTVGFHYYSWNEYSTAAGTTTWLGSTTYGGTITTGLIGWIEG